jgi:hypothetical protein
LSGVDRLQSIIAQLRSGLSTRADRSGSKVRTSASSKSIASNKLSEHELRAELKNGIAGLNLSMPADRRQARRVFVVSVLLSEFGVTMSNDPRFLEIVNGVETAISEDEQLTAELDIVLSELAA